MTSGTEIIERALANIKAHSVVSPAPPETVTDAMNKLNSMLQDWQSNNIEIGFIPLNAPSDELGEPADTTNAIVDNLAVEMAPSAGRISQPVSQTLQKLANRGFYRVQNNYQTISCQYKVVSSTLPLGQGNRRWGRSRVYAGKGHIING